MMNISWNEFWWNNITGSNIVVSKVADALLDNRTVILNVPSDLPWRDSMRSSIQTSFQDRTNFPDVIIDMIDVVDENPEKLEPGRFLLKKYASSKVEKGYREKSRISIQDYIVQNDVFKNRIIWVKGVDNSSTNKWVKFCRGFSPKNPSEGLFVLEIHEDITPSDNNSFEFIDFSKCVSSYDVQLLNSFILDEMEGSACKSNLWKSYIAATVARVCNVDAEVSEQLLREVDFRKESAIDGVARIADMPEFSRRGADNGSDHVLWYCRNGKTPELEHRVWTSQVQVLFPVIEMERVEYVQKYYTRIARTLADNHFEQYGEHITEPMDLELGSMCYLMSHRGEDNMYKLYIPDEKDRERIKFLHQCRNKLAHVCVCCPEEVRELLDGK